MSWIFITYEYPEDDTKYVVNHCLPPALEQEKNAYIKEKYSVGVFRRTEVEEMWMDLGGMVSTKDPTITIRLDKDRTFCCYTHHISGIINVLQNAKEYKSKDGSLYWRFMRWPGVLLFISDDDRTQLIHQLLQQEDKVDELEHSIRMREALIKANTRNGGPEVEKKVRKIFNQLDGKKEIN